MRPYSVYSFDLFDTVISRKTGSPKGIFCMIQNRLGELSIGNSEFNNNFFSIRSTAEEIARKKNTETEEVTLEQIYSVLEKQYPEIPIEKIQEMELDFELRYSFGIFENIEKIQRLLNEKKRVILISDMYLPLSNVRKMLLQISSVLAEIPIYLSSEIGKRKGTGHLFQHVLKTEKIAPENLFHTGDNLHSDILPAHRLGIETCHYTDSHNLDPENKILFREDHLYAQLMCGASRFARLSSGARSGAFLTAVSFTGPFFYPFVSNILFQDRKNVRLHFMARDGYVLKLIADEIIRINHYSVKTNYFYASRETLILPALTHFTQQDFDFLIKRFYICKNETLSSLCKKLFLPESTILEDPDFKFLANKKRITSKDFSLFSKLIFSKHLDRIIENECTEKRLMVLKYMEQTGFKDSENHMIDVGWLGNSFEAFDKILNQSDRSCEMHYFFFCPMFFSNLPQIQYSKIVEEKDLLSWSFSLELFCRADHGKTIGYVEENGVIKPVLTKVDAEYLNWPFHDYNLGIVKFSETFSVSLSDFNLEKVPVNDSIFNNLVKVMKKPPLYMAESVGSIRFTLDCIDSRLREAAPPLTFLMLLKCFYGKKEDVTVWFEASFARSKFHCIGYLIPFLKLSLKIFNFCIWLKRDGIRPTIKEAFRQIRNIGK